jgi:3-oxoacyl-[acyl-carrier-protein] synthase-3
MKGPPYKVKVAGIGSYTPARVLTNEDLSKMVDTSDEWITTRTGIKERRISAPEEATSDMALPAARKAIQMAGLQPSDIELIIVATSTPDYLFPTTACQLQHKLGCPQVGAFDILAACPGFIYGLSIGRQYIAAGGHQNLLLIGADTLSKITNYQDRTTCVLFGDGAGAVVLQRSQEPSDILYVELHADGAYGEMIIQPAGGSRLPASTPGIQRELNFLHMRGREVYKFAVAKMIELIQQTLKRCSITIDEIALVIPHQVNMRIIESASERLGLPAEKVYVNIDRYGNTSAASIPIALDEVTSSGRLKRGDLVLLIAFGSGLTWGACLLRW